MHVATATFALALALAAAAAADVEITAAGDRLDVSAAGAPVSEVLDGLARKTRMKVVYDGAVPRTPVTVELRGRTPAQAVLGVLEGLGLNYALVLDASGTEVDTLMIVGTGHRAANTNAAPPRPARGGIREPSVPPPVAPEDDSEVAFDEDPWGSERATNPEAPKSDEAAKPAPIVGPLNPSLGFPVSPFAPVPPGPVPAPSPSPKTPSGD